MSSYDVIIIFKYYYSMIYICKLSKYLTGACYTFYNRKHGNRNDNLLRNGFETVSSLMFFVIEKIHVQINNSIYICSIE